MLFVILGGCLTPIEIPQDNTEGFLVLSGQITSLEDRNVVQLATTAGATRLPYPVEGATVELFDDIGNSYCYNENAAKPGTYVLEGISGIPTVSYYVMVTLPSGKVYKSIPEKMPEAIGYDSVYYRITKEDYRDGEGIVAQQNFLKIYSNVSLPSTEESIYLKWNVEEVYLRSQTDFPGGSGMLAPRCYITQNADPQRIVLFEGTKLSSGQIGNQLVCSRLIDRTFLEKRYFTTIQSSLTPEAFEYWRRVNVLANQVGSIFDTPPAVLTGNIYNEDDPDERVFGYFQATNQVYDRFVMYQTDLPFPMLMPNCTYDPSRTSYPNECLNCLILRNSSLERPPWF